MENNPYGRASKEYENAYQLQMQHYHKTAAVIDGRRSQGNLKGLQKVYKILVLLTKILIRGRKFLSYVSLYWLNTSPLCGLANVYLCSH